MKPLFSFLLLLLLALSLQAQTHTVLLNFNEVQSGDSFNIYRMTGTCTGSFTGFTKIQSGVTTTTYADPGVVPGQYCYYVTSMLNNQESGPSNQVNAVVQGCTTMAMTPPVTMPPPATTPTFSDAFNEGTLDNTKWTANSWTTPNYAGAGSTDTSAPANCDLTTGMLRITLTQPTSTTATGCELQSKQAFGFGTYEWSLRASSTSATPTGAGSTVSGQISTGFIISDSTSHTEIDSPEIEGRTPTVVEFTNWLNGANGGAASITAGFNPQDGFHLYKFIWSAASVQYYIDGALVSTHSTFVPLASNPGFVLISHYGTNSNSFGGTATVGTTRYLYCNSFKYWTP